MEKTNKHKKNQKLYYRITRIFAIHKSKSSQENK